MVWFLSKHPYSHNTRSATIEYYTKIIAVKDAMRGVESYMQQVNVDPFQVTTEVAFLLLSSASVLLIVPFKYILSLLILDLLTQELEFRREMVKRFISMARERWHAVPAAPVVVLPYENDESRSASPLKETEDQEKPQGNPSIVKSR